MVRVFYEFIVCRGSLGVCEAGGLICYLANKRLSVVAGGVVDQPHLSGVAGGAAGFHSGGNRPAMMSNSRRSMR